MKEINVAHVIKKRYCERGFDSYPKILPQQFYIDLTDVATIYIGKNTKSDSQCLWVFSDGTAVGNIIEKVTFIAIPRRFVRLPAS
jgi:hypothetical protein